MKNGFTRRRTDEAEMVVASIDGDGCTKFWAFFISFYIFLIPLFYVLILSLWVGLVASLAPLVL